eukprot:TRINITY_DN2624_c0_g1_i1.p3 TRINITY_DN2624_c0_g1~~TRINITY_DN2624_c0_g1_i1.p3  ORF type:complete len:115 (+),score=4.06 TRINITY_DN2624_c0_g1_i1:109-453(+)
MGGGAIEHPGGGVIMLSVRCDANNGAPKPVWTSRCCLLPGCDVAAFGVGSDHQDCSRRRRRFLFTPVIWRSPMQLGARPDSISQHPKLSIRRKRPSARMSLNVSSLASAHACVR